MGFHGKCDDSTRFACPRNDAACKFNRKIKGKWFCVHHEQSSECESARDEIKIRGLTEEEERDLALLGTTSDRVDRFDRCWFHGKCGDSTRFACPRNDAACKFNRKIKGKWFCVHHEQSSECESARDDIKIRGLTEEEERDLACELALTCGMYRQMNSLILARFIFQTPHVPRL